MVTSVIGAPQPQVHLFQVKAAWHHADGQDNRDLWVRAVDEPSAFDFWKSFYDVHEDGVITRSDAEDFYDDGFSIKKVKTYAGVVKLGAIDWDEVEKIGIAAL